jgi:hypothetical protein
MEQIVLGVVKFAQCVEDILVFALSGSFKR